MNTLQGGKLCFMQWAGLLASLLLFSACTDDSDEKKDSVDFDQVALFKNIGETLILPGYAELQEKAEELQASIATFVATPSQTSLTETRTALLATQLAFQQVTPFEFGPAEEVALHASINTYPTEFSDLEIKIQSGSWDFNTISTLQIKGLPAVDYLLYSQPDDQEVLAAFTSGENADKRRQYLTDLATDILAYTSQAYNGWNPAGQDYLSTFSTNTGNSASSSLSLLVNALIYSFEEIKNEKIGEAAGYGTFEGTPIPKSTEAYHSKNSKELAQMHLATVENIFRGQANGTDRTGLDDYLEAYYLAGAADTDLNEQVLTGLATAAAKLAAIPNPLSVAVEQNPTQVKEAYDALQALVPVLKVDMVSILGVTISYTDNDGD